ncbi:MAG: helix-turn-helix domain-containing protein [Burkholderiales bacterium]
MALRRAIGDDPRRPRLIHTVRGSGYRLARADNG